MLGPLKKRQGLVHHDTVDRSGKTRECKGDVRTLAHQQLNLVTQLAHLIERRILNFIERDQEATVARSLVHRLPQLRRRLGYLDGTQAHTQYRRGYRQRGHFAIPREGTENAIAKARVRGDVNHMEPMLARDVSKCVKEHGLTHATDPGNAKYLSGAPGPFSSASVKSSRISSRPISSGGFIPAVGLNGLTRTTAHHPLRSKKFNKLNKV